MKKRIVICVLVGVVVFLCLHFGFGRGHKKEKVFDGLDLGMGGIFGEMISEERTEDDSEDGTTETVSDQSSVECDFAQGTESTESSVIDDKDNIKNANNRDNEVVNSDDTKNKTIDSSTKRDKQNSNSEEKTSEDETEMDATSTPASEWSNAVDEVPTTTHKHNWQPRYKNVKHPAETVMSEGIVKDAWDEEVYERHAYCTACGFHNKDDGVVAEHARTCTAGGYISDPGGPLDGKPVGASYSFEDYVVDVIHHDPVVESKEIVVKEAWNEKVLTDYICKDCGEIQEKEE